MANVTSVFQPYTAAACDLRRSVPGQALCVNQVPGDDLDALAVERERDRLRNRPLAVILAEGLAAALKSPISTV